jgi:hypothetical protein
MTVWPPGRKEQLQAAPPVRQVDLRVSEFAPDPDAAMYAFDQHLEQERQRHRDEATARYIEDHAAAARLRVQAAEADRLRRLVARSEGRALVLRSKPELDMLEREARKVKLEAARYGSASQMVGGSVVVR